MTNWVGKDGEIGIPADSLFIAIFTLAGYALICGAVHVILKRMNPEGEKPTVEDSLFRKLLKTPQFFYRAIFLVMAAVVGYLQIHDTCDLPDDGGRHCDNWHLIYWYSLLFVVTANISNRPYEFYLGEGVSLTDLLKFYLGNRPLPTAEDLENRVRTKYLSESTDDEATAGIGFWTLMPSAFITWIFAKSIRNSAVLGARFGVLGGLAYDSWYLSFFSSAIVCYVLRIRYNFKSLPTAIFKNYGGVAVICFQLCVLFRLFNEVWSNSSVIGSFYGSTGSDRYWGATWFSVAIPAGYVLMGGMRVSLFSDVFQAALAVLFLAVILGFIASDEDFSKETNAFEYKPSESVYGVDGWQPGWWAYTAAGALGGSVSYPWFDPVLTDRAFLGRPKTMLKSFFVGGFLAMCFIFFYAVIGIYGVWLEEKYAGDCGCSGGAVGVNSTSACPSDWNPCQYLAGTRGEASDVAAILGQRTYRGVEVFVNLVMITASLSTLDSTFTSASKLVSLEFCGWLQLEGDTRQAVGPLRPVDIDHIGHQHITVARAFIVFLMFVGNSFLGMETDAMKATTIAGMAVMGLGFPIWWMTIWRTKKEGRRGWRKAPLAFVVPFAVGWFFGLSYYFQAKEVTDWKAENTGTFPESELGWTYDLNIAGSYTKNSGEETDYAYGRYLGTMLLGHAICFGSFIVFFVLHQVIPLTAEVEAEGEGEDAASKVQSNGDLQEI